MSNGDLEEGDVGFTTLCDDPMKDDSAPIINILELFKHLAFVDGDSNCDDSDDCGHWNGQICCKSALLEQIFA